MNPRPKKSPKPKTVKRSSARRPAAKSAPKSARRGVPNGTRAVVMAGGKGTRLLPYTTLIPKPLVPIGERPILHFVLEMLRRSGFKKVTLCVGHLSELIQAYFGDGSRWGIDLNYAVEDKPLSTMGPLAYIDDLSEDFLVMNGDILTDLDPVKLFRAHRRAKADMTVATYGREVKIDYGVLNYGEKDRRVNDFTEKPSISYDVSMGVYVLNRRCLDLIPKGRAYGFDDLMETLLEKNRHVLSFPYKGRWLDIGRPEDFEIAQAWELADDS